MAEEDTASYERRGVENPSIVDLITPDSERCEVVLVILEGRPWGSEPEQLAQLEDKLNSYFSYVLDGHLVRQYPQYQDMPVAIRLDCAELPGEAEEPFLRAVRRFCSAHGMRFVVRAVADPFAVKAPWES